MSIGIADVWRAEGAGAPLPQPIVTGASAVDSTTVHVTFDQGMKHVSAGNPDDALNPANYTFGVSGGEPITSVSVAYIGGTNGKEYQVTTVEQTGGASYTVYVNNVESSLHDLVVDPLHNFAGFTGHGDRPAVESATADSATQVTVVFDELMDHNTALETGSNYTISGPTVVSVTSVVATDGVSKTSCACQLTGEMTTNGNYTVTVTNVSDVAGNPIPGSPPDNQASFLGIGINPQLDPTAHGAAGGRGCKIVFSESMSSSALVKDNYVIEGPPGTPLNFQEKDPPPSGIYVENVDDDYTYILYTEQQVAGQSYTVTIGPGLIYDQAGNDVIAPHNVATFTGSGFSPPDVTMNPGDGSVDVDIRHKLLITAKDPTGEFTGINKSTWWSRLTFSREGASGELVQYAIKNGEIQQGFEGGVYAGDPMDSDIGLTLWVRPLAKKWLEFTEYKVETYVEDNESVPNQNLVIGTFRTGKSTCFEDALPTPTATDALLMAPLDHPNCEKLRRILMEASTTSDSGLVKARTIMHLACVTDSKTMLAGHFDYSLVDNARLCDRLPILEVYKKVIKYPKVVKAALNEVPALTNVARAALMQQLKSNSAVYVVNGVALIVLLCALLDEE